MDIRYIYMQHDDGGASHSHWMRSFEAEDIQSRAVAHAADVMQCSVLVVERDPISGYMVPLGFAAY